VAASPASPGRARKWLGTTFSSLGQREYRVFAIGQAISLIGNWMQQVAIGWTVLLLTDSPLLLGVAAAARALPILLFGFPGGMAADRYDRRRILWIANGLGLVLSAILAGLVIGDLVTVPAILALAFLLGTTQAFEIPARQSFYVELAGREHMANAIAVNALFFNLARVLGPAFAGILVAVAGPGPAFAINALTYIPVLIGLAMLRTNDDNRAPSKIRGALSATFRYLRVEQRVTLVLLILMANTIFASGHLYLGPAIARDLGQGADGFGLLLSAVGLGAIVGTLVLASRTAKGGLRWRGLVRGGLFLGVAQVAVALSGLYPLTLLIFGVIGFGWVSVNATANMMIQSAVQDEFRGRVMSLYSLVLLGFQPFGGLLLGWLGEHLGASTAMGIGGAAWVTSLLLIVALRPVLRTL
jgi:MFS family permease